LKHFFLSPYDLPKNDVTIHANSGDGSRGLCIYSGKQGMSICIGGLPKSVVGKIKLKDLTISGWAMDANELDEHLSKAILYGDLSNRVFNILDGYCVRTYQHLYEEYLRTNGLKYYAGIGRKSIREIKEVLKAKGFNIEG